MLRKMVTSLCFTLVLCLTMVANVNIVSAGELFLDLKSLEGDYEVIRAGECEWGPNKWISPYGGDIGAIVRLVLVPGEQTFSEKPEIYGIIIKAVPGGNPARSDVPGLLEDSAGHIITIRSEQPFASDDFPGSYESSFGFYHPADGENGWTGCRFYVRDNGLLFFCPRYEHVPGGGVKCFQDDILELKRIN